MSRHPDRDAARRLTDFRRAGAVMVAAFGVTVLLSACVAPDPEPSSSPSETTSAPSVSASPTATPDAGPVLVPDGTATDNLPLFAAVTEAVWATPDNVAGRAYIDALVAAGFDKAAMQVTEDLTTVGNPVESLQFSVLWAGECLVGQVGPATGAPVAVVVPVLGEGNCLVGRTRPIDW